MDKFLAVLFYGTLLILQYCSALEYNKRPLNANTDFLLHENGGSINSYVNQNGGKRDYDAQFPALSPPVTPKPTSIYTNNVNPGSQQSSHSSNGMRDYVAPQWPLVKPNEHNQPVTSKTSTTSRIQGNTQSSDGKRDYVAPQFPTLQPVTTKSTATTIFNNNNFGVQSNSQSSNGKRDYVAPQYPALKPIQSNNQPMKNNEPAGGNVQDLINFYDNRNPNQGPPSYSSIMKNPNNKNRSHSPTASTQSTLPMQPTKPMSFSSVVAGGNRPASANIFTTAKSTAFIPSAPGSRPGTPVLPSSIANNNANNGNTVTDAELQTLSEELLRKDSNNAARYITINYQDKTTSQSKEDRAPQPLLTVSPEAWNIPTVQKFIPLLDNYERDAQVNEHVTPQERIEENAFVDAVMSTAVMRHLMTFLKNKGYVSLDIKQQRDFVKQLWFTLYARAKGKIGSSGFEHVFVSELKNREVSGLHNWIYFAREEAANRLNYLGYLKYEELNDKGAVLKYHFNQQGVDKPVNSMFIGTSPELEIALYTLCYVTRVDDDCKLKLANKDVTVITYNFRYRSKNLIGSAYPQI